MQQQYKIETVIISFIYIPRVINLYRFSLFSHSVKGDNSVNPYDDLESGAVTANGNGETLQVTSFVYSNDATAQENNAGTETESKVNEM